MSPPDKPGKPDKADPHPSRRGLVRGAAGFAAAWGAGLAAPTTARAAVETKGAGRSAEASRDPVEPFRGVHQGGITTPPQQSHSCFAALDLTTAQRAAVVDLLRGWTALAARMTAGEPAQPLGNDAALPGPDTGEALGLPAARLTLTFGFGAALFVKDGRDRFGLADRRPPALVDLPRFNGDQLIKGHSGGDLSIQACADDPQVAFHAVRQLARFAEGRAEVRWVQSGFVGGFPAKKTPRNLMGFKDGTINPPVGDRQAMAQLVWVGGEGPDWMRGGSYVVVRRIRMALEHWDRMKVDFQERVFGRRKYSGAPLGGNRETDPLDLKAADQDGNPVIPENAHVRLAAPASNDGAQILRRSYSYNDGANFIAERWPPWRQGIEYDAGLFFVCYQRDPRSGFIRIFERISKLDMLNQFVTHTGSGLFACAGGVARGEFIGQRLFATA